MKIPGGVATFLTFIVVWAPLVFFTVFMTVAMLCVGIWDSTIPIKYKLLTPFGLVLFWIEIKIAGWVVEATI